MVTLVCTAASAYSLSLSLHTGDSASLTTAGVETDPLGYPRASCLGGGGLSKQLGVQPPTPGNSNTEFIVLKSAINSRHFPHFY
jgi:hypothetical protein